VRRVKFASIGTNFNLVNHQKITSNFESEEKGNKNREDVLIRGIPYQVSELGRTHIEWRQVENSLSAPGECSVQERHNTHTLCDLNLTYDLKPTCIFSLMWPYYMAQTKKIWTIFVLFFENFHDFTMTFDLGSKFLIFLKVSLSYDLIEKNSSKFGSVLNKWVCDLYMTCDLR